MHSHQQGIYQHKEITSTDLRKSVQYNTLICYMLHYWYIIRQFSATTQEMRVEESVNLMRLRSPVLEISIPLLANASVKSIMRVQIADHSLIWQA